VISASFGAGHDGAAAEISRQLDAAGFSVDRHDFVDLVPGRSGSLARAGYRRAMLATPRGWDYALKASGNGTDFVRAALGRVAGERTAAALGPAPALVVSTYPLASQVLGRLRETGRLQAPAITFLTDMSVHPLWVTPGIDVHLALHDVPAAEATALGAARTIVGGAAVRPGFRPALDADERAEGRRRHGLPPDRPLALVAAGSWGVGAVGRSAREIAATGLATPVVVCGNNHALRRRIGRRDGLIALGWVDDMAALIRACDVVVQNAGGLTSLEELVSAVPVVTYRCLPGHGRTNAAALEEAGWARWPRDADGLAGALWAALAGAPRPRIPVFDAAAITAWLGVRVSA
jgi:hypothetical protein